MNTITDFMGQDHDRLDGLFNQFQIMKNNDPGKAKHFFSEFKQGLQRHIVWEEDILFPLFESRSGVQDSGPTAVMRMEHRRIRDLLDLIHDRIADGWVDTDAFESGLVGALAAHNKKEETVLYPWIDQFVSEQEVDATLASLKAVPAERYHNCCGETAMETERRST